VPQTYVKLSMQNGEITEERFLDGI